MNAECSICGGDLVELGCLGNRVHSRCRNCGAQSSRESKLEPVTYTLPASWASYLINGDASGLEDGESSRIDYWLLSHNLPSPVDCSEEAHFARSNDATQLGGDVLEYTFLIRS
ncbi:MAG TPA: hypothetical protein VEH04_16955 [Verrucomicrobiae bacterium]|nr:hypothetical protein [Verrucomicrobiae bacterium]